MDDQEDADVNSIAFCVITLLSFNLICHFFGFSWSFDFDCLILVLVVILLFGAFISVIGNLLVLKIM